MLKRRWIALVTMIAVLSGAADSPPNPSFYLVNRGSSAIGRVYVSPAGMPNWGTNKLAGAAIAAGDNAPIRLAADGTCIYDVRIVYTSGISDERRDVDTCAVDNLIFPRGATAVRAARRVEIPSFLLVNRGRTAMNELYLSPSGNDSWGEDRLGDGFLAPGSTRTIRLPAGDCLYDYRVVFANGNANEKRRVDLCQIVDLKLP